MKEILLISNEWTVKECKTTILIQQIILIILIVKATKIRMVLLNQSIIVLTNISTLLGKRRNRFDRVRKAEIPAIL